MFKSDVRSYYASINHDVLYDLLRKHIIAPNTLSLIYRFMKRTVTDIIVMSIKESAEAVRFRRYLALFA